MQGVMQSHTTPDDTAHSCTSKSTVDPDIRSKSSLVLHPSSVTIAAVHYWVAKESDRDLARKIGHRFSGAAVPLIPDSYPTPERDDAAGRRSAAAPANGSEPISTVPSALRVSGTSLEDSLGMPEQRLTLLQVLDEPDYRAAFTEHLKKRQCLENLGLYSAVNDFQAAVSASTTPADSMAQPPVNWKQMGIDIYNTYVSEESLTQVNLPGEIFSELHTLMESGNFTLTTFDKAQKEAKKMMESDAMPAFLTSPAYRVLCRTHPIIPAIEEDLNPTQEPTPKKVCRACFQEIFTGQSEAQLNSIYWHYSCFSCVHCGAHMDPSRTYKDLPVCPTCQVPNIDDAHCCLMCDQLILDQDFVKREVVSLGTTLYWHTQCFACVECIEGNTKTWVPSPVRFSHTDMALFCTSHFPPLSQSLDFITPKSQFSCFRETLQSRVIPRPPAIPTVARFIYRPPRSASSTLPLRTPRLPIFEVIAPSRDYMHIKPLVRAPVLLSSSLTPSPPQFVAADSFRSLVPSSPGWELRLQLEQLGTFRVEGEKRELDIETQNLRAMELEKQISAALASLNKPTPTVPSCPLLTSSPLPPSTLSSFTHLPLLHPFVPQCISETQLTTPPPSPSVPMLTYPILPEISPEPPLAFQVLPQPLPLCIPTMPTPVLVTPAHPPARPIPSKIIYPSTASIPLLEPPPTKRSELTPPSPSRAAPQKTFGPLSSALTMKPGISSQQVKGKSPEPAVNSQLYSEALSNLLKDPMNDELLAKTALLLNPSLSIIPGQKISTPGPYPTSGAALSSPTTPISSITMNMKSELSPGAINPAISPPNWKYVEADQCPVCGNGFPDNSPFKLVPFS
ncbi:hypothetical protein Pelo_17221 [Pelomyxa schiedti]|nr:hypothetical protein Pelo_17221 [Pelomyxa schiedti]